MIGETKPQLDIFHYQVKNTRNGLHPLWLKRLHGNHQIPPAITKAVDISIQIDNQAPLLKTTPT